MSNKAAFDRSDPNAVSDLLRQIAMGSYLRGQGPQVRRKATVALDNAQLATLHSLVLPNDGKAGAIQRAYARAGVVTGELTPVAYGVTPATTQIAVAPNGDIVVLAADAITSLDVEYLGSRGDPFVFPEFPVVANVLTLPTEFATRGVLYLVDANVTVGGSLGRKIILVPGAGAPAAGQARLNIARSTVTFAGADAVTRAVVTVTLVAAADLHTVLEANETAI